MYFINYPALLLVSTEKKVLVLYWSWYSTGCGTLLVLVLVLYWFWFSTGPGTLLVLVLYWFWYRCIPMTEGLCGRCDLLTFFFSCPQFQTWSSVKPSTQVPDWFPYCLCAACLSSWFFMNRTEVLHCKYRGCSETTRLRVLANIVPCVVSSPCPRVPLAPLGLEANHQVLRH